MANAKKIVVLLVCKDMNYARVATDCLRSQGEMDVDVALLTHDAFEKIGKNRYDAIICEMEMPDMSGFEFLKILRVNGNKTLFFMIASNDDYNISAQAFHYGANGFFRISDRPDKVYPQIRKCIESWAT